MNDSRNAPVLCVLSAFPQQTNQRSGDGDINRGRRCLYDGKYNLKSRTSTHKNPTTRSQTLYQGSRRHEFLCGGRDRPDASLISVTGHGARRKKSPKGNECFHPIFSGSRTAKREQQDTPNTPALTTTDEQRPNTASIPRNGNTYPIRAWQPVP